MRPSALRVSLLAAVMVAACTSYVEEHVEGVIIDTLPRVIGPADRYEATVQGANRDASYFDKVHAVGIRVQRRRTPVIDHLEVDLQDVSVDRPNRQVTAIGAAHASVRVRAADLTAYLQQQSWIAAPSVRLSAPDGIVVTGSFKLPGINLALSSLASLRGHFVAEGPRLLVAVDSLSVGDREASALLRGLVATAINPFFDLPAYAVPSTIDRAILDDDAVVVEASGSRLTVAPH